MKLLLKLIILMTLVSFLMVRCANISAPTGGLRDSLPPRIIRTTPNEYTKNFSGKKVLIEFDEYIKLKDQQKLFFVSPPGSQKPRLTIKGRALEVLFEEKLDSATTYRLDFGSSITDNNEGNPLHGYSYIFSTGDVIDSLAMVGQTLGAYERDTVMNTFIFYFDATADSAKIDSTVFKAKADALFRTDSSGYFIANILKDKKYRIYALDDKNGNQLYEAGTDRIAFSEQTYNPTELEGFTLAFDSTKKYMTIDPLQITFELFKEIPVRRQMITKQWRTHRQKILMTFNSPNPITDSLQLEGIDPKWIIQEKGIVGDTVTLWIAPPTKEDVDKIIDTIRGTMVLQREDSVWKPFRSVEKLSFIHKIFEKKKKKDQPATVAKTKRKKGKKQQEALPVEDSIAAPDSITTEKTAKKSNEVEKNPFGVKVNADNPLNPEQHISFEFDFPLRTLDSSRIQLIHIEQIEVKGKNKDGEVKTKEVKIPFTIRQSADNIRRWVLRSNWKVDNEYKLIIPSKVFQDITFESNDTLQSTFKIANPDKFGTLTLKSATDTAYHGDYIYELLQGRGEKATIVRRQKGVTAGQTVIFSYLKAGSYYLRIVRDSNQDGKWETGSLTHRLQPEMVRMVIGTRKEDKIFIAKENWNVEEVINLTKLFEK